MDATSISDKEWYQTGSSPPHVRLFVDVDATSVTCAAWNRIGNPMPEARPQLCGVEPDRFRRLVLIGVVLNRIGDPLPEVHPRRGVVPDWDSHWNILIANTKNGTKGAFVHHDAFGSIICPVAALAR